MEKKMVQLENELVTTTTNLENTVKKLEEREKALQNVSQLLRLLQLILCMPSTPKLTAYPVCLTIVVHASSFDFIDKKNLADISGDCVLPKFRILSPSGLFVHLTWILHTLLPI